MPTIKTVGICTKPNSEAAASVVPGLLEWLLAYGVAVRADEQTAPYAGKLIQGIPRREVPDGCDLIVVLGGDGTLLSAARAIGSRRIPLFAVNMGGLGFLTALTVEQIYPELERTLRGEYQIDERTLLKAEVVRARETVATYDALNDAVLSKAAIARMIDMDAFVDDQMMCAYKADGLIVSTPTGSTAYSLSAGGPIIYPSVPTICITPICPHMLTNRPVLVPQTSVIRVVARGPDKTVFLTIDGQVGVQLCEGDAVVCRSSDFSLRLIRPPHMKFFDVLREKLKWGER